MHDPDLLVAPDTERTPFKKSKFRASPRGLAQARGSAYRGRPIPEALEGAEVLRRDALHKRLVAASDVLAAALAVLLAIGLVGGHALSPALLAGIPVVVLLFQAVGLYSRDEIRLSKATLDEAPRVFQVSTVLVLLLWLSGDAFLPDGAGRGEALVTLCSLVVFTLLGRAIARALARSVTPVERCLLIGDAATGLDVRRRLYASFGMKAELVGRVPIGPEAHTMRHADEDRVLGSLEGLGITLMEQDVHRVIIAPNESSSERILDTVRVVKALGVKVSVLPRLFEVVGSSVEFDEIGGMPLLGLRKHGLSRSSRILKRGMDVAGAGAALFLLGPLMLMIALGVKISSPGPVLFRQERIGRGGRVFKMLKFRTMVDGAEDLKDELRHLNEADGLFKIADDPRVTAFGRFLRRSSLDELPQLLNVLRGEMSLVGPRPLVREDDARIEGWQRRRLGLTPGMTGFWQVLGGARIPLHEMVKIDYLYAANWSLWLDAKILLRTAGHVTARRGL